MIRAAFALALLLLPAFTFAQTTKPTPDYLVGVYYFSGWWPEQPNKYTIAGKDWRSDWPGRKALMGEFVDQPTVDREIDAAAKYGVSFFQFLWYKPIDAPDVKHLNDGLQCFMASPNASKMKFTVEFCNHAPFGIKNDAEWEKWCGQWTDWMKNPNYLHVDGRAVFKIHGLHFFVQDSGGAENAAKWITTLRRIAREKGVGELLISAGIGPGEIVGDDLAAPFDFFTTYMDVPQLEKREVTYPYAELLKLAARGWTQAGKSYVPYLPAGWDPRPWHDPRPSFDMPTKPLWIEALTQTKQALDANKHLGIPLNDGKRQKMLLIYAWNEFGEGGIVAPTAGKQYEMLEGICEVFPR